jgi:hypothetical protein
MLTKLLGLKVAQKVVQRLDARADAKDAQLRRQQYIPAGQPDPAYGKLRGNSVAQKAGQFYQQNPKLVASLATVVLAGLAAALAKKRGMY